MTETKTIEDGYEVRRDETGRLLGWRLLSGEGPRPAVKTAPGMSTKSATTSAPSAPVEDLDFMGNPPMAEKINPANLENRKASGVDFADAVDARNDDDDADDLEIA